MRTGLLAAWEPARLARVRRRAPAVPSEPLVSVPIATYDRPEVLVERTLPALLAQTYGNLEVIVIGDGCPPSVARRIERFRDGRVTFRNLARRSRYPRDPVNRWMVAGSRPRNVGMRASTGDLLLWISDDELLHSDAVERMLGLLAEADAEIVLGVEDTSRMSDWSAPPSWAVDGVPAGKVWLARRYLRIFGWSRVSWLKYWNRPADYDLFSRMQASGVRFARVPTPVCTLLPAPGSAFHGSRAWRDVYGATPPPLQAGPDL